MTSITWYCNTRYCSLTHNTHPSAAKQVGEKEDIAHISSELPSTRFIGQSSNSNTPTFPGMSTSQVDIAFQSLSHMERQSENLSTSAILPSASQQSKRRIPDWMVSNRKQNPSGEAVKKIKSNGLFA